MTPVADRLRCPGRHGVLQRALLLALAGVSDGVLHYDARQAVFAQTLGVIVHAAAILSIGWLGDRVSPRALLRAGALLMAAARVSVLSRACLALVDLDAAPRARRRLRRA